MPSKQFRDLSNSTAISLGSNHRINMTNFQKLILIFLVAILSSSFAFTDGLASAAVVQDEEQQEDGDDKKKPEAKENESKDAEKESEAKSNKEENKKRTRIRRGRSKQFSKNAEVLADTFSPVVASSSESVVKIMNGDKQLAFGTVVDSDGLILTKASELRGNLECVLTDKRKLEATVLGIDDVTDLALLKIEATELSTINWNEEPTPEVGIWVANANQSNKPFSIGIVSHNQRKIANSRAMIGITLDASPPQEEEDSAEDENSEESEKPQGVRITGVSTDSPADEAGLLINDVITSVDDQDTQTYPKLRERLGEYEPGDKITLKIVRAGEEMVVDLTLTSELKINPMMAQGNAQDRMGSKLSRRRRNFPLALQHDSMLNSDQCGGPIVDLSGRAIGINIARSGRVSSLALPNEVVLRSLELLKSGDLAPMVVNKTKIETVKKELGVLAETMGDLPEKKLKADVARSAAVAQQEELERIIRDAKKRLEKLQKENAPAIKKAKKLSKELNSKQLKKERLEAELKLLSTGIK